MRVVAIVQARMTSSRLPGKVLLPLGEGTILRRVMARLSRSRVITHYCIAVPEGDAHQPVVREAESLPNVGIARGSEIDVLQRYAHAARQFEADYVLRVTSDCPWIDAGVCDAVLMAAIGTGSYARTAFETGYPLGFDCEAMPVKQLLSAEAEATKEDEREHVTPFIWRNPDRFPQTLIDRKPSRRHWRMTLDEPDDYTAAKAIEQELDGAGESADFAQLEQLLMGRPELLTINSKVRHKHVEGAPIRPDDNPQQ